VDIADQAQKEIERREAFAQQQRAPVAPVGETSANECQECGLEIPSARQLAIPGTQHCTECAGMIERGLL